MRNVEIRSSLINVSEIMGKALALNAFHFIYNQVFERLKIKHASPLAGRKTSLFYFVGADVLADGVGLVVKGIGGVLGAIFEG